MPDSSHGSNKQSFTCDSSDSPNLTDQSSFGGESAAEKKKKGPLEIRVTLPDPKREAIDEWQRETGLNIPKLALEMRDIFEKNRKMYESYYNFRGIKLDDSIANGFAKNIRSYVYRIKGLHIAESRKHHQQWRDARQAIIKARRILNSIPKMNLLKLDVALELAGHPDIDEMITEALLYAADIARERAAGYNRAGKRAKPISHFIALLVDDIEEAIGRTLPHTFEMERLGPDETFFSNGLVRLVFDIAQKLDPLVKPGAVVGKLKTCQPTKRPK